MIRSRAKAHNELLDTGKWFCRRGWLLFPYSAGVASSLRRAKQSFLTREEQATDPSKSATIQEQIQRLVRENIGERAAFYNAQPQWHLRDIEVRSVGEAKEVVHEFLDAAKLAAIEFCWPTNRPDEGMDWQKHDWKHVAFDLMDQIAQDAEAGSWLPPEVRLEQIGSIEYAQELFRQANRGEPEAVARLDFLFPSKEQKDRAAKHLFVYKTPEEQAPQIPASEDVAAKWVRTAIRFPDSMGAEKARNNLKRLVSKHAAKGSGFYGGRSSVPHHRETVLTIFMMSYGLFKQLREIDGFLGRFVQSRQEINSFLNNTYPWLSRCLCTDLDSLRALQPTAGAGLIAGKLLKLSTSKVEKIVYPRQPLT